MVVPGAIRSARPSVAYFFRGKRVMDTVLAFTDGKNARDIDHEVFSLRAIRPGSDPARVAISAVVRLRANVIQTGRVDPVRLAVHRLNQLFGFELFEDRKGAVAQQQPFAGVAFNGGNAAGGIADVRNTATFGENV